MHQLTIVSDSSVECDSESASKIEPAPDWQDCSSTQHVQPST